LELLHSLYQDLFEPVIPKLKTALVAVVPSGPLNLFPFSALYDGNHYVGEDFAFFSLPSASSWRFIQGKVKPLGDNLFAVSQNAAPGFARLRFADSEAKRVAALFGTSALITPDGTKAAFLKGLRDANLIHVAAHGAEDPEVAYFSRVMLGADQGVDGSLPLHEIFGLELPKANLVVLSACETQVGFVGKAEDFVGMSSAFIYAGAPAFMGSLWTVDDESTSALMEVFYKHLEAGSGASRALQEAENETRARFPHPYYWAPFVPTGYPGQIISKTP
jgi:CHAT domain-containing protein